MWFLHSAVLVSVAVHFCLCELTGNKIRQKLYSCIFLVSVVKISGSVLLVYLVEI